MKVVNIIEHEDGSATVVIDMTKDEINQLVSTAVIIGLTEGIKLKETQSLGEL